MQRKTWKKEDHIFRKIFASCFFIYMNVEIVETWNCIVNNTYKKLQPIPYNCNDEDPLLSLQWF